MNEQRRMVRQHAAKWLIRTLVVVAGIWLFFLGYIGWAMRQPPEVFGRVMSRMPATAFNLFPFETMWTHARRGHLIIGDMAPSFNVETLETRAPVELGSLWAAKPVVLVFGSYT